MNRPVAASRALHDLVHGDPASLEVIAAFPLAVYVEAVRPDGRATGAASSFGTPRAVLASGRRRGSTGRRPSTILSIVAPAGLPHPNSAVLAGRSEDDLVQGWRAGTTGCAGEGRLELGGTKLRVTRWWDPRPTLGVIGTGALAGRLVELDRVLRPYLEPRRGAPGDPYLGAEPLGLEVKAAAVTAALVLGDSEAAIDAGLGLVGLGPGLTPAGDDVLCGLFASALLLRAALRPLGTRVDVGADVGADDLAPVRTAAARLADVARERTPVPSAALLWHAGRGHAAGPLAHLLQALTRGTPDDAGPSLERHARALVAVGSTSGHDLAIGLRAGARLALHLADRRAPSDRPAQTDRHSPPSDRVVASPRPVPSDRAVPSGSRSR